MISPLLSGINKVKRSQTQTLARIAFACKRAMLARHGIDTLTRLDRGIGGLACDQAGAAHSRQTSNAVFLNYLKMRRGTRWRWTVKTFWSATCIVRKRWTDLDNHLIHMPTWARLRTGSAKAARDQTAKLQEPPSDRLIRDIGTPFSQQLLDVSEW